MPVVLSSAQAIVTLNDLRQQVPEWVLRRAKGIAFLNMAQGPPPPATHHAHTARTRRHLSTLPILYVWPHMATPRPREFRAAASVRRHRVGSASASRPARAS